MRRHKTPLALVAMAAFLFGLTPGAWAGGITGLPDCVAVDKTGTAAVPSGGPEMSGSAAIHAIGLGTIIPSTTAPGGVDVTLSLKFRNQLTTTNDFIEGHLPGPYSLIKSPEDVACDILDALHDQILNAFGIPLKQLKICFSSPTSSADKFNCRSISSFSFDFSTGLGLAIIDRIFVVD